MTAMSQIVVTPQPVPLGKSGILVSPMAWGMWRFAGATLGHAHALVETALDAGITLFDTADIYDFDGSGGFGAAEALFGQVLAALGLAWPRYDPKGEKMIAFGDGVRLRAWPNRARMDRLAAIGIPDPRTAKEERK